MIESSRRNFLRGLGFVTAGLLLVPDEPFRRIWSLGAPLRLWGDGIHDDAPALQALIAGRWKEVIDAEKYVHQLDGGGLVIGAGRFRVEDTIELGSDTHIVDADFNGPMEPFLRFSPTAYNSSVMHSRFTVAR